MSFSSHSGWIFILCIKRFLGPWPRNVLCTSFLRLFVSNRTVIVIRILPWKHQTNSKRFVFNPVVYSFILIFTAASFSCCTIYQIRIFFVSLVYPASVMLPNHRLNNFCLPYFVMDSSGFLVETATRSCWSLFQDGFFRYTLLIVSLIKLPSFFIFSYQLPYDGRLPYVL